MLNEQEYNEKANLIRAKVYNALSDIVFNELEMKDIQDAKDQKKIMDNAINWFNERFWEVIE